MLIVVLVTIPKKKAPALAKILLKAKLCACVNIIDEIISYFWWENKIQNEKESLLIIKTKKTLYKNLKSTIERNHPYSVPEILSIDASAINKKYWQWVLKETIPPVIPKNKGKKHL